MGKSVKKVSLFNMHLSNTGEYEKWLYDMADQGLYPDKIKSGKIYLKKSIPRKTVYRIAYLKSSPEERIKKIVSDGWNPVCDYRHFFVFASPLKTEFDRLSTDREAEIADLYDTEQENKAFFLLFLLIMIVALILFYFLGALKNPYLLLVKSSHGSYITDFLLAVFALLEYMDKIKFIHKTRVSLTDDFEVGSEEGWKMHKNRTWRILFITILLFLMLTDGFEMISKNASRKMLNDNSCSIIRLTEVEHSSGFHEEDGAFSGCEGRWGLLVPVQLKMNEYGADSKKVNGKGEEYRAYLGTEYYKLSFSGMSKGFLNDLIKDKESKHNIEQSEHKKINDSYFDEAYVFYNEEYKEIYVRRKNKVMYIMYKGDKDVNSIIYLLKGKM